MDPARRSEPGVRGLLARWGDDLRQFAVARADGALNRRLRLHEVVDLV